MQSIVSPLFNSLSLAWAPGYFELLICLGIALLLFGNRLPGTMRSLGQSLNQFKKGMREGEEDSATSDRLQ
ncbi:MAG: twin-arginine translocase TatA/TatE family subunit [Planctomycetota bacterium]